MSKRNILDCPIDFDKGDFLQLLSLSAGWAIACQNRMGELIGDSGWNVDLKGGSIKFGDKTYKSGILGSESDSGTWLWAWENTEGGLPEIAAAPSRRVKKALPCCAEFQNGKFGLDELHTGHNLSMISCVVSGKNICYYRCPHTGGAEFVTVEGLPDSLFQPLDLHSFMRQYMEIISVFYCDHRMLAAGFLYMNGNDIKEDGNILSSQFGDNTIKILFEPIDGLSRVVDISITQFK